MEEEKKKKKNKKKKNKQAKQQQQQLSSDDSKVNSGDASVSEQNHSPALEQNHQKQISNDSDVPGTAVLDSGVNPGRDHSNGTKEASLDETEKRLWLQREAVLEERVKQLEIEKDSCIQMEVVLEKKIKDLQKEKDFLLQKEASMDQKLEDLLNEKANWTLREASLEDRIKQLENDKKSWILKENSAKETIDRLSNNYTEVQAQVNVLQESRDGLVEENQRLMERLSVLQSLVQHLEEESSFSASSTAKAEEVQHSTKNEDTDPKMEAASSQGEQIIENAEFVDKGLDPTVHNSEITTAEYDISESHEKMSRSGDRLESLAILQTKDDSATSDHANTNSEKPNRMKAVGSVGSSVGGETDEIVQIPLDENEIQEVEVEEVNSEEKTGVPLADAPLTGAPFRFISFVARYVSGADLINKSNSNS